MRAQPRPDEVTQRAGLPGAADRGARLEEGRRRGAGARPVQHQRISLRGLSCHETLFETRTADRVRTRLRRAGLAGMLEAASPNNPLAPKAAAFPGARQSVIHLFMHGGVSHVDTFDPKPELTKRSGETISAEMAKGLKTNRIDFAKAPMRGSPWKFQRYGQSRHGDFGAVPRHRVQGRRDRADPLLLRRRVRSCARHVPAAIPARSFRAGRVSDRGSPTGSGRRIRTCRRSS